MLRAIVYSLAISVSVTLTTILVLSLSGGLVPTTIDPIFFVIAFGVFLFFGMMIGVYFGMNVSNDIYD